MLNAKDKSFYTGLIPDIFKWAKEQGYTLSFDNKLNYLPKKPFDDSYIERMKTVGKYTPKDYQEYYVVNALKRNMALILSPTGSGKSFIIYLMIRYMLEQLEEYEKILINVPSISLAELLFKYVAGQLVLLVHLPYVLCAKYATAPHSLFLLI
jgi:CRISPR/Cas system-associated endonuclease/helicase Cas3